MTDKTMRDIQSEIAGVIPEPRNLVTRLEYARRVLAIPAIKEGLKLREKAKSGVLGELCSPLDAGPGWSKALVRPLASGESR